MLIFLILVPKVLCGLIILMSRYSGSGRGSGSFLSSLNNLITGLATGTSSSDKTKSLVDELEEETDYLQVVVLKVIIRNNTEKAKALRTVVQISGDFLLISLQFPGELKLQF